MFNVTRIVLGAGALAGMVLMVGCSDDVTVSDIRRNPTPSLAHLSESEAQVENARARIFDNYGRAFWDDIDRLLRIDDNPNLTPTPLP